MTLHQVDYTVKHISVVTYTGHVWKQSLQSTTEQLIAMTQWHYCFNVARHLQYCVCILMINGSNVSIRKAECLPQP